MISNLLKSLNIICNASHLADNIELTNKQLMLVHPESCAEQRCELVPVKFGQFALNSLQPNRCGAGKI